MPESSELRALLDTMERLADSGPDWSRTHLADLLVVHGPAVSFALLRGDEAALAHAVDMLLLMVRRYIISTAL